MVPPPLRIALITAERLDSNYKTLAGAGWTLVRFRTGNLSLQTFDTLHELLQALVDES